MMKCQSNHAGLMKSPGPKPCRSMALKCFGVACGRAQNMIDSCWPELPVRLNWIGVRYLSSFYFPSGWCGGVLRRACTFSPPPQSAVLSCIIMYANLNPQRSKRCNWTCSTKLLLIDSWKAYLRFEYLIKTRQEMVACWVAEAKDKKKINALKHYC